MRLSRLGRAALPFIAAAGLAGTTLAPPASAHMRQIAHGCGATAAWAKALGGFVKSYDRGSDALGTPAGNSRAVLAAYLSKEGAFFQSADQQWAVVGKAAPSGVSVGWDTSVADLQKAAQDFGVAGREIAAGHVSQAKADAKAAYRQTKAFAAVLAPIWKRCS